MTKDEWPKEIENNYERVRPLGRGGFGIVWLAKTKDLAANVSATHDTERDAQQRANDTYTKGNNDDDDASIDSFDEEIQYYQNDTVGHCANTRGVSPEYVAIKCIHAVNEKSMTYASREIKILSEINHPNAIRCIQSVQTPESQIIVLTLADGPNLQTLVDNGGALSLSLARLSARHLIAAVSYLHEKGVIHRDIKPNNCIITKVHPSIHVPSELDWKTNDAFWDDKAIFDEQEWKLVLVDFGLAKVLKWTVTDDEQNRNEIIDKDSREQNYGMYGKIGKKLNSSTITSSLGKFKYFRSSSMERLFFRDMSSVGTRGYAAPEVIEVRERSTKDNALADGVSDYGLIADSYSVGCAIRVLLTGIPVDVKNIPEYVIANDSILLSLVSAIFVCRKKHNRPRKKRYKFLDEVPKEARELVMKLTKLNVEERLTVQLACDDPWLRDS